MRCKQNSFCIFIFIINTNGMFGRLPSYAVLAFVLFITVEGDLSLELDELSDNPKITVIGFGLRGREGGREGEGVKVKVSQRNDEMYFFFGRWQSATP